MYGASMAGKKAEMQALKESLEKAIEQLGRKDDTEKMLSTIEKLSLALIPAAKDAVRPIGSECDTLSIGKSGDYFAKQNIVKSDIRTTVRIRKPAYEGLSKWTLVYIKAIEASIEDINWLNKFQTNQIQAPPGTALDVELEETIITDERGEAIEEPTYIVKKVHGIVPPP